MLEWFVFVVCFQVDCHVVFRLRNSHIDKSFPWKISQISTSGLSGPKFTDMCMGSIDGHGQFLLFLSLYTLLHFL